LTDGERERIIDEHARYMKETNREIRALCIGDYSIEAERWKDPALLDSLLSLPGFPLRLEAP